MYALSLHVISSLSGEPGRHLDKLDKEQAEVVEDLQEPGHCLI